MSLCILVNYTTGRRAIGNHCSFMEGERIWGGRCLVKSMVEKICVRHTHR